MIIVRNTTMNEELIQFSWMFRLYPAQNLRTTDNESIEIIDPGQWNRDSGPDFFNAKVKIGKTLWAGNVEIHKNSSEWYLHGHHTDAAYNNVILHVVIKQVDTTIDQAQKTIPTLILPIYKHVLSNYDSLLQLHRSLPCENKLGALSPIVISDWLCNLALERLNKKNTDIRDSLILNQNHWEEAFYQSVCRSFGSGKNGLPFELLAKSLPLKVLNKHHNNLFQLEALLFGQAGFLDELLPEDAYVMKLTNEYRYLAKKYRLNPIEKHLWKFLRMRPSNFPTVRLAQLAKLYHNSTQLLSTVLDSNLDQVRELFNIGTEGYWDHHYRLNIASPKQVKHLGVSSINSIIINTLIPFIFAQGKTQQKDELCDRAIAWLEVIPAEKNAIITKWESLGFKAHSAFETQALIQLNNHYCTLKKCLHCRIGHQIIAKQLE